MINYKVKQDFIAEAYCENKDAIFFDCQGRCFLSKTLKETHDDRSTENLPEVLKEISESIYLLEELYTLAWSKDDDSLSFFEIYSFNYKFLYAVTCFHPPKV